MVRLRLRLYRRCAYSWAHIDIVPVRLDCLGFVQHLSGCLCPGNWSEDTGFVDSAYLIALHKKVENIHLRFKYKNSSFERGVVWALDVKRAERDSKLRL